MKFRDEFIRESGKYLSRRLEFCKKNPINYTIQAKHVTSADTHIIVRLNQSLLIANNSKPMFGISQQTV
jgi:hypothetical protein